MKKGSSLEDLEKMKISGKMMIIVRGSIIFAFWWSNCNSWILTMIKGQMNNCSFIWTLSEIFDYFLEFEAFMLSFDLSHVPLLFWCQLGHFHCFLLLMDQVVPLCENREYFRFQTFKLIFWIIANVFIKGEIVDIMGICAWS